MQERRPAYESDSDEWERSRKGLSGGIVTSIAAGALVGGMALGFGVGRATAPASPAGPPAVAAANELPVGQIQRPPIKMTVGAFRESVHGRTRQQVEEKYGPPHDSELDLAGGWDGPMSLYNGEFTTDKGETRTKVRLVYKNGVVHFVDF